MFLRKRSAISSRTRSLPLHPPIPVMCLALALSISDIPETWIECHRRRIVLRGPEGVREMQFHYRDPRPELPAWHAGGLATYLWGNRTSQSALPRGPWCELEDLEAGRWRHLQPSAVDIPVTFAWEKGIWYLVPEGGLRGVLVRDERDVLHAYLVMQPASHYYRIMTRSLRMPVFLGRQM